MKKTNSAILLLAGLLLSVAAYAQQSVHSGIIQTANDVEQLNVIKIHCASLTDEIVMAKISAEFNKYDESIYSYQFDLANHKIYVKYTNGISPNMLLGILERIYYAAYYLDNNVEIHYTKTGSESFRR